jgi:hypothetical protein
MELHTFLGNDGDPGTSSEFNYQQGDSEEPGPTIKKILEYLISSNGPGDPGECSMFVVKEPNRQGEMNWNDSFGNAVKCHIEELGRFQEFVRARPGDDFRADSQEFATLLGNVTASAFCVQDHWDNPGDYIE